LSIIQGAIQPALGDIDLSSTSDFLDVTNLSLFNQSRRQAGKTPFHMSNETIYQLQSNTEVILEPFLSVKSQRPPAEQVD
jgi:hypothetical protein